MCSLQGDAVEVEIHSTGLNFRVSQGLLITKRRLIRDNQDVLCAMGIVEPPENGIGFVMLDLTFKIPLWVIV
jgi:hypothetical protein